MRILDDKDTEQMHQHVLVGAVKGFAVSAAIGIGGAVLLQRYSQTFRNFGAGVRLATVVMPICAGVTIGAENALIAYERDQHLAIDDMARETSQSKTSLPKLKEQFDLKRFVADHRYHFVAGAWLAGVAGTLAMSYGNPYITPTQKAFHARVYSQGITVAAIIGTALLTPFATDRKAEVKKEAEDLFQRRLAYEERRLQAEGKMAAAHA